MPTLSIAATAPTGSWVPEGLPPAPAEGPALCPGNFLQPEQGKAVLDAALARFPDRGAWETYAAHVRTRIQEGLGLAPFPERTPLDAVVRDRRVHDGYSVESVAFESVPGFFVTGSLYRPLKIAPRAPAVIATHGHSARIEKTEDYAKHGRFGAGMQARCATLARMGAVVLALDMVAYGDSMQLFGQDAHKQPATLTLQSWNATRAVDFLVSLPDVDPARIAVSGESGGATQAFILMALDPRVAVATPTVMVSSFFFGGCPCESGLPIHRSADHFASNALIAALAAPRPLLVISDGKDWTRQVPEVEFPFLQKIYGYYGATAAVANVHLAEEGHDYGPSKRAATYRFLAQHLGLDLAATLDAAGGIDESHVTIETPTAMRVFTSEFPIPARALHDVTAGLQRMKALQK